MPPQPALPWHPAFVLLKDKSDGLLAWSWEFCFESWAGSSELLVTAVSREGGQGLIDSRVPAVAFLHGRGAATPLWKGERG